MIIFYCFGKKGFCETNDYCHDCQYMNGEGGVYIKEEIVNAIKEMKNDGNNENS